ncbi:M24 family metallopeptidase [Alkalihalobacillus sp. 1P02AB]|uniref:M24 family metallopeptidase n=1 Tax=Alkalihalobacillus sp. 1P02AB TaxID=3132260 RepID=UPI0039A710FD
MYNKRIQYVQNYLKQEKIDFAFIQGKANLFYLTGFRCEPHERLVSLIVTPTAEPVLVAPHMERSLILSTGWQGELIGYSDTENPWELLSSYLHNNKIGTKKMAIEPSLLSYERSQALIRLGENTLLQNIEETLLQSRLIKSQEEKSILQEAAKLADFGVEVGVSAIQAGRTEIEIIAKIEFELKKKGVTEMSFNTLVLTGANSANPHGKPGINEVKPGDFVLFDLGVVYEGYCSDITRTVAFDHVSDKQQEIYATVLKAQLQAIESSVIGKPLGQIDEAARSIITDAGYGDYFPHRIGHGLGTEVHEWPSLNATNTMQLQEGMVYTIEPGIYVPHVGGVRIEDDIFVEESGPKCLTNYPKELQIIK